MSIINIYKDPGGLSYVEYGLKNFNFQSMYVYEPNLYQGCMPFTESCKLLLYILVCLTNSTSDNEIIELRSISHFYNLTKTPEIIGNFFANVYRNSIGCHTIAKEIYTKPKKKRDFYKDPIATFKSGKLIVHNKLMIMGAIFRKDKDKVEFMLNCGTVRSRIKRNDYLECQNTRLKSYSPTYDYIQYFTIWARLNCFKYAKFDDCGPNCFITFRNTCSDDGFGFELCLSSYRKRPVTVRYYKHKKFILSRIEDRCTFRFNCVEAACEAVSSVCICFGSNKCGCEKIKTNIQYKNGTSLNGNTYFLMGTVIKCNYDMDPKLWKKFRKNRISTKFTWEIEKTSIKYGLLIHNNLLTLGDTAYYNNITHGEDLFADVKCVLKLTHPIPSHETKFTFKLYKPPKNLTIQTKNGLLYTNQQVICEADGYPRNVILFEYRIPTKNFKPDTGFYSYLKIPHDAKLGLMTLQCRARLDLIGLNILSDFSSFNLTLVHLSNLSWGLETDILYAPTVLSCSATLYTLLHIDIFQIDGPSILMKFNKSSFNIMSRDIGGQYEVLCTYLINRDRKVIYNRIYKFHLYRYPNAACLLPILGNTFIHIVCLHNGYPLNLGPVEIKVLKYVNRNLLQKYSVSSNRIKLPFEGIQYKYKLRCTTTYDGDNHSLEVIFTIQSNAGLTLKSTDLEKYRCSEFTENEYAQINNNKFWIENPRILSFHEIRICLSFMVLILLIAVTFFVFHIYSYEKHLGINLTLSSLSRRHSIMRMSNRMTNLALFRLKNSDNDSTAPLRRKFEAYKRTDDVEDFSEDEIN